MVYIGQQADALDREKNTTVQNFEDTETGNLLIKKKKKKAVSGVFLSFTIISLLGYWQI